MIEMITPEKLKQIKIQERLTGFYWGLFLMGIFSIFVYVMLWIGGVFK